MCKKKGQWMYSDDFDNIMWMLKPLGIEKNFVQAIGDWLERSGCTKIH